MPCNNFYYLLQCFATNMMLDPFDYSARSTSHEAVLLRAALALIDKKSNDLLPTTYYLLLILTSGQANTVPQVRLAVLVPRAASRRKCPP
jgi:hypothetical protein